MLTVAATVALLPALSVAVPVVTWPAPSAVSVVGLLQSATPDGASEQVYATVTSPLYQPAALAAGACAVMTGLVRSTFTVALALAVLPALSVASAVTTCLA